MQTEGRKGHKEADWLEKASEPGRGGGVSPEGVSSGQEEGPGDKSLAVGDPEPVLGWAGQRESHTAGASEGPAWRRAK